MTHDSEWDYENVRVFTTDTNMKCAVVALSITILIYSILNNRSLINRFAVLNCIAWENFLKKDKTKHGVFIKILTRWENFRWDIGIN